MQSVFILNEALIPFAPVGCDIRRIAAFKPLNSTLLLDSCQPVPTRANGRIDRIELMKRIKIYDLSGKTFKCQVMCKLINTTDNKEFTLCPLK